MNNEGKFTTTTKITITRHIVLLKSTLATWDGGDLKTPHYYATADSAMNKNTAARSIYIANKQSVWYGNPHNYRGLVCACACGRVAPVCMTYALPAFTIYIFIRLRINFVNLPTTGWTGQQQSFTLCSTEICHGHVVRVSMPDFMATGSAVRRTPRLGHEVIV